MTLDSADKSSEHRNGYLPAAKPGALPANSCPISQLDVDQCIIRPSEDALDSQTSVCSLSSPHLSLQRECKHVMSRSFREESTARLICS